MFLLVWILGKVPADFKEEVILRFLEANATSAGQETCVKFPKILFKRQGLTFLRENNASCCALRIIIAANYWKIPAALDIFNLMSSLQRAPEGEEGGAGMATEMSVENRPKFPQNCSVFFITQTADS